MTATITFTRQPSGQEIATLGKAEVGIVLPYPAGRRVGAMWRCFLFVGDRQSPNGASTIHHAKRQLILRVADWHDLAGGAHAALAEDFRAQAAALREAA
jgi:hypothetical protein